jgi:MYXO-CTERM domain-containing protein
MACQIQCQETSFDTCKTDYTATCKTQCSQPQGALFCDGSYVDVGSNLTDCVDALNAIVTNKITLSVTASGSTTCSGDTCTSTGTTTTKATCSASSAPAPGGPLAAFGAVFAMALAAARRRSKR